MACPGLGCPQGGVSHVGSLVIYSVLVAQVISHRYGLPTWQPSDKGAMFNHGASYYFKFHIVCLPG